MRSSLLVALALTLAACGGASAPSAADAEAGGDAAAEENAAPGDAAAPEAPGGDSGGPAFAEVVTSGKLATYKVTYKMSGTGGADAVSQTWYFKPPLTRFDMGDDEGQLSFYFLEKGTYMCTAEGGESFCLQTSEEVGAGQSLGFEMQNMFAQDPDAWDAVFEEKRTIAGQEALCFVIEGDAAIFAEGTFCYTATGLPLLMEWAAGGESFTMEATAFSTDVPDSDFELPAAPTSY